MGLVIVLLAVVVELPDAARDDQRRDPEQHHQRACTIKPCTTEITLWFHDLFARIAPVQVQKTEAAHSALGMRASVIYLWTLSTTLRCSRRPICAGPLPSNHALARFYKHRYNTDRIVVGYLFLVF